MEPDRGSSPRRAELERALLRFALGASLALSALALAPRAAYFARLAGTPTARERGALAADERVSPLTAAGQVRWRRELARRDEQGRGRVSGLALAWDFFADPRNRFAPGSRVFLSRPNDALYQFGNFLWYPTRLEVAPEAGAPLADGEDLRRAASGRPCSDRDWLLGAGYAGCIEVVGEELRRVAPGRAP